MLFIVIFLFLKCVQCQVDLANFFRDCQKTEETFDDCTKDGLNSLRAYFKSGLPDYGILPLDPFHAAEIPQKRSGPFFNYKLILRNVTEEGWSVSQITKFKTDFNKNSIQYTQYFPDKRLNGLYEIDGTFFGQKVSNRGSWNLSLYDYTQTSTVTRKPVRDGQGRIVPNPPLKVQIQIQNCKNMELHIGHLAGGRTIVENMLDWIINTAWQPGFIVLSPLINDLISTAFTEIFNKSFRDLPLDKIFPN